MFKASYNRAALGLKLTTVSPLSIRAGDVGLDPASCDLVCIRSRHSVLGRTVFVPGSSLKGVLRSTIEAQLRAVEGGPRVCDPLRDACSSQREVKLAAKRRSGSQVHAASCVVCRLFGSTVLKGRCAVRDHFPFHVRSGELSPEEQSNLLLANTVEVRPGVAIGRLSGSVEQGPFEQEMVPEGVVFWGDIAFENFQAWQLGAVFAAIRDLDEGFAQLGSGKTKGLGVVRAEVTSLIIEQRSKPGEPERPRGVGDLINGEAAAYGFFQEAELPEAPRTPLGIRDRFDVPAEALVQWQETTANALSAVVEGSAR